MFVPLVQYHGGGDAAARAQALLARRGLDDVRRVGPRRHGLGVDAELLLFFLREEEGGLRRVFSRETPAVSPRAAAHRPCAVARRLARRLARGARVARGGSCALHGVTIDSTIWMAYNERHVDIWNWQRWT